MNRMTAPAAPTTPVVPDTPAPEAGTVTPPVEPTEPVTPDPEAKPDPMADLPQWAREAITKANSEAANYRTRLRDAETKLSAAKTPEEFEAAVAEVKSENAKLERALTVTKVATKYNLPTELAEALRGDDEAALEAHAKSLAKFVPTEEPINPDVLSGGLTPGATSVGTGTPRELAQRHGPRRR